MKYYYKKTTDHGKVVSYGWFDSEDLRVGMAYVDTRETVISVEDHTLRNRDSYLTEFEARKLQVAEEVKTSFSHLTGIAYGDYVEAIASLNTYYEALAKANKILENIARTGKAEAEEDK